MSEMGSKTIRTRDDPNALITKKLEGFQEIWVRNQGQRLIYIFYYLTNDDDFFLLFQLCFDKAFYEAFPIIYILLKP